MPFDEVSDDREFSEFPQGEPVVSMVEFNGRILIATTRRVYEIVDGQLHVLRFRLVE